MTATHEGTGSVAPLLPQDTSDVEALLKSILKSLDDSKAEDIVSLDLAGKTSVADYMVVASGRSHRHVGAVTDHLLRDLKDAGYGNARVEGLPHCDWVLVDIGDAIIHIFRPEVRGFYNVEKMWSTETTTPTQYIG
ncbi:ribosome silencing factor [Pseudovibrio exalbescens]|uniref:ribosome silencing factor n=1 Tax=Pseudovibrio exalbescens TaxID=197461 RepID=UPI000C99DD01|nr:ribosome silencing factor [Pseudovibrio exalbescens]